MSSNNTAIWLYGSYARGDEDIYSDLDLLVVDNELVDLEKIELPVKNPHTKISLSQYTWYEIERMASYGSLFLHHLSCEAKPILESEGVKGKLFKILHQLGLYLKAKRDLEGFKLAISDVEESIKSNCSFHYELSVLATILRHSSILGCYVTTGQPIFGRNKPIETLVNLWNLDPMIYADFNDLYFFKLHGDRINALSSVIEIEYVLLWCARIKFILKQLEKQVNIYERNLLKTNPTT